MLPNIQQLPLLCLPSSLWIDSLLVVVVMSLFTSTITQFNVTNMESMFANSEAFNQPIDKWDVSNVTNMEMMFYCSEAFNQPINKWNVRKVTNMKEMFNYAKNFNQTLSA